MMATLRPCGYGMIVMPSPVSINEESRPSGLLVQYEDTEEDEILRGVVMEISDYGINLAEPPFKSGDIIYYFNYSKIRDIHVVLIGNVIAWEAGDEA